MVSRLKLVDYTKRKARRYDPPVFVRSLIDVFILIHVYSSCSIGKSLVCIQPLSSLSKQYSNLLCPLVQKGGGWVRRRCPVAFVTGASNWYWLTAGKDLQQVRVEGYVVISYVPSLSFTSLFLLYPSFSSLLSLFSLSLGDDTNDPQELMWH